VPALPEPVRQAAERLLALQPALDETISADSLKQALGRSGLFLEAHLASAANGDVPTRAGGAASNGASAAPFSDEDVKAALIVLRNVLKPWLPADQTFAPTSGAPPRLAALAELARAAFAPLPEGTAPSASAPIEGAPAAPTAAPRGSPAP